MLLLLCLVRESHQTVVLLLIVDGALTAGQFCEVQGSITVLAFKIAVKLFLVVFGTWHVLVSRLKIRELLVVIFVIVFQLFGFNTLEIAFVWWC